MSYERHGGALGQERDVALTAAVLAKVDPAGAGAGDLC